MDFLGFLAVILLIINLDLFLALILFLMYKSFENIKQFQESNIEEDVKNNDFWK